MQLNHFNAIWLQQLFSRKQQKQKLIQDYEQPIAKEILDNGFEKPVAPGHVATIEGVIRAQEGNCWRLVV